VTDDDYYDVSELAAQRKLDKQRLDQYMRHPDPQDPDHPEDDDAE